MRVCVSRANDRKKLKERFQAESMRSAGCDGVDNLEGARTAWHAICGSVWSAEVARIESDCRSADRAADNPDVKVDR